MKTQHTPGPWYVTSYNDGQYSISDKPSGYVEKHIPDKEDIANARLIASAPELLAALIEAKELLESVRPRMPKSIRNSETFHFENVLANSITKTIQKATQP